MTPVVWNIIRRTHSIQHECFSLSHDNPLSRPTLLCGQALCARGSSSWGKAGNYMIPPFSGSHTCVCGCNLQSAGALTKHEKQCLKGQKQLAAALGQAKEIYQWKKCHRGSTAQAEMGHGDSGIHFDPLVESPPCEGAHSENAVQDTTQADPSVSNECSNSLTYSFSFSPVHDQ